MSTGRQTVSLDVPGGVGWLLLRGLVRERRHWGAFPERLAARTGGPVLCLDLPGVGTERDRRSPASIAGIVEDLRERFLAARGDGEWAVFAPSLGGMIAMAWALAHPEDFVAVAVCNTSARDLGGALDRFSFAALGTVLAAIPGAVLGSEPLTREARTLGLVSNTAQGRAHAEAFASLAREAPIGPDVLFRQLWAAWRAVAPARLPVPLKVICSDGDRLCSPALSRALAARLDAPLHVHPDAGHDLPLDDPDWVIDCLVGVGSRAPRDG